METQNIRPIKFRYIYVVGEDGRIEKHVFTLQEIEVGEVEHDVEPLAKNQFTSLKDKNGKEIFEGDILKVGETYHEVFWGGDDYPAFDLKPGASDEMNSFSYLLNDIDAEDFEVVGNIYEHPDILKK